MILRFIQILLFILIAQTGFSQYIINDITEPVKFDQNWTYIITGKEYSIEEIPRSAGQGVTLPLLKEYENNDYTARLWLKKEFIISKELKGREIYLITEKMGGWFSFYLNGVLIKRFGRKPPFGHSFSGTRKTVLLPPELIRYDRPNTIHINTVNVDSRFTMTKLLIGGESFVSFNIPLLNFFNAHIYGYFSFLSLFICLYFLFRYFYRKKESYSLFFALTNLGFFLYFLHMSGGTSFLPSFIPFLISKAILVPILAFLTLFFTKYFDIHNNKKVSVILVLVSILNLVLYIVIPRNGNDVNRLFSISIIPIQIMLIFNIYIVIRALIEGNKRAGIIGIGLVLAVILQGYDVYHFVQENYPSVWLQGIGLFIFNTSIYISLAKGALEGHNNLENYSKIIEEKVTIRTRELETATRQMEQQKERADEANKAKTAFLANMSHEMRTPLNGIIGFAEILNEKNNTPDCQKYCQTIISESERLRTIIDHIFDISSLETGQINLEPVNFQPENLVSLLETKFRYMAEQKNLDFSLQLDNKVPKNLIGDFKRIIQILSNIIENAIKFTDIGYVNVFISSESLMDSRITLKINIEDTGIGIPEKDFENIFKSFYQVDSSATRKHGGTGLGITIAKQLIFLMNGTIDLLSQEGQGSNFTIRLECNKSPSPDQIHVHK